MSRLYHVNAFSHHPFGGNPAVVVLGEARPGAELQAMAAEFNLSESAFLTQLGEGHYGLRWFTPQVEVDLCGHGTLAAAHVLWQTGELSGDLPIRFATRSGELVARREGEWIWLDFPRIVLAPLELDPAYGTALGCQPLRTLAASRCAHWRPGPSSCLSSPARRRSARSPPIFTPCGRCRAGGSW